MNTQYAEKNSRMVAAINAKEPYALLVANNDYYSLVQIGSDRIPLTVLTELIGGDIPYEPEITLDRDTKIEAQKNSILKDLVSDMLYSIKDDPDGEGTWRLRDGNESIIVFTRHSRNERYSRNGGDYDEWREYSIHPMGVIARDDWSCDIQSCNPNTTIYKIDMTDMSQLFIHACNIIAGIQAGEKSHACPTCGSITEFN